MTIPFLKAHGAGNDFLFTFARDFPGSDDPAAFARAICHRNTGVGADGWYLIEHPIAEADAGVRLWNADGSYAELSGNGSRCVCAILVDQKLVSGPGVRLLTGSGVKTARLIRKDGDGYWFSMDMGTPAVREQSYPLVLSTGVTVRADIIDVGNPQCVVMVDEHRLAWQQTGAEIERHALFQPAGTNVSFVRLADKHTIDVRFWERGAHHTLSSGTGSLGAAVAAIARGIARSPVTVQTEFCPLVVAWEGIGAVARLTGPAQITARGEFVWEPDSNRPRTP